MGPITPDDLRFNRFGLSSQESRVLALAMTGNIDKQIAAEMGISLGTVRVYWKRIRAKVGGTRSEVIAELARTSLKLNFDDERGKAVKLAEQLEESMVRERSLRVYESVFETLPTPLAILDGPTGRFVHVNAPFAKAHMYSAEELVDLPSTALMVPDEIEALREATEKAVKAGHHAEIEGTRRRKDGTTFPAKAVLSGSEHHWVLALEVKEEGKG